MNEELNFLDRFLYKFIICLVILVTLLLLDKGKIINIEVVKSELSENINMLKVLKFVNGEEGVFLDLDISDKVTQTVSQTYLNYEEIEGGKRILLNELEGVSVYKAGVVVKILQNSDNTFQVTVKGVDDVDYVYDKLETIDVNIYKIVQSGDIIGKPKTAKNKTYFDFYD